MVCIHRNITRSSSFFHAERPASLSNIRTRIDPLYFDMPGVREMIEFICALCRSRKLFDVHMHSTQDAGTPVYHDREILPVYVSNPVEFPAVNLAIICVGNIHTYPASVLRTGTHRPATSISIGT